MTETNGIHILNLTISAWVYAPALFIVWLIVLYSAKGILFVWLHKWGEKTKARWDLVLTKSLHVPGNVIEFVC